MPNRTLPSDVAQLAAGLRGALLCMAENDIAGVGLALAALAPLAEERRDVVLARLLSNALAAADTATCASDVPLKAALRSVVEHLHGTGVVAAGGIDPWI